MDKLKEALQKIFETATNAPELNMANYDEDQVRDLNNAMLEVYYLAEGALAETSNEPSALPIPDVSGSVKRCKAPLEEYKSCIDYYAKKKCFDCEHYR